MMHLNLKKRNLKIILPETYVSDVDMSKTTVKIRLRISLEKNGNKKLKFSTNIC